MTDLLFKWTDVPAVQSENIQEAPGIEYVLLPRFITGQSCRCTNVRNMNEPFLSKDSSDRCFPIPLSSWSSVLDRWLSLLDWIIGESENFSSHLTKDGHAAKPWSNELRKQVLLKFNRPGTIPERKHKLLFITTIVKLIYVFVKANQISPFFLFFLSVSGPHRT